MKAAFLAGLFGLVGAPKPAARVPPPDEREIRELHVQGPPQEPPPEAAAPRDLPRTPFSFRFRDAEDLRRLRASLRPMPLSDFERITSWYRRANLYAHWDLHRKVRITRIFGDASLEGVWLRGKKIRFRLNTLGQRPVLRAKRHRLGASRPAGGTIRFEHPYYAGYSLAVEAEVTNTTGKPLSDVQVWASKKSEQVQQRLVGTLDPGQTASVRFSFFFKDRWLLGADPEQIDLAFAGAPEGEELEDLGHTL